MRAFLQNVAASGRERMSALATLCRRLIGDRRGNILMITGFALIPITFSTGMVVDYSRAARLQTKLNAVADASTLAATTTPMLKKSYIYACNAALNAFTNGSAGLPGLTFSVVHAGDLSITLDETYASGGPQHISCQNTQQAAAGSEVVPLSRIANVTYAGKSANAFGGILGSSTIDIGGTSSSKVSTAPFIDIHMALDTSQSMGLAATDADAKTLYQKTGAENKEACTFGCHVSKTGQPTTNELIARKYGLKLRVDVLKDATVDMIQSAIDQQKDAKLYQFALYRMGQTTSDIATLSDDLPTVKSVAQTLELGPNTSAGLGDSNLADVTTYGFPKITAHGDGTTKQNARAFFFIVTDGLSDLCGSNHCTGPIDPKTCQRYKDAGITVGVVYTTYLPILANPTNGSKTLEANYVRLVQPHDAKLGPNLQACASPGWYFQASDGATIHTAMQKLFAQASQTPTITR